MKDNFRNAALPAPLAQLRVAPAERYEHHGIFEALAAVDGDQLHRVVIAFEAELKFFAALAVFRALFAEPFHHAVHAEAQFDRGLVQDFAEMQHIGEATFAVGQSQQARADLFALEQATEHLDESCAAPLRKIIVESRDPLLPGLVSEGERFEFVGGQAEEIGGERGFDEPLIAGFGNGGQHALQFGCFVRFEQAGGGVKHRRHAALREHFLHPARLIVAIHQHGDVLGPERSVAQRGCAIEQTHDFGGSRFGKHRFSA